MDNNIINRVIGKVKNGLTGAVVNIILTLTICTVLLISLAGNGVINASANNKVVYRGSGDTPTVALMFNVCWGTEYVEDILTVLRAYNVKCTFFLGGSWVDDNNELVKKIASERHELANHGYHHLDHSKISSKKNEEEIAVTGKLIAAISGVTPKLFAPPSGAYSDTTVSVAEGLGYTVVMWSKDTIDWRDKDASLVYTRATNGITNGELILMHPTAHTLSALPEVLSTLKEAGFSPTTVSKCIGSTAEL